MPFWWNPGLYFAFFKSVFSVFMKTSHDFPNLGCFLCTRFPQGQRFAEYICGESVQNHIFWNCGKTSPLLVYAYIGLCCYMQALYPTSVIVLVNSHRTFDQTDFMEASLPNMTLDGDANNPTTLQRMSFASAASSAWISHVDGQIKSETLNEFEQEKTTNRK